MNLRAPHVKRMRTLVDRALFDCRKTVLANLAAADTAAQAARSGAYDFLFDIGELIAALVEPIFRMDAAAYDEAGNDLLLNELSSQDPFISADPLGMRRLQERRNFIKDAAAEVWSEIRDALDEGLQAGESYAKLADRVRAQFNEMSKERGMRIAVTETGIAFESGRYEAMRQAGVLWKIWHSSLDGRVRDTHLATEGRIVAIDEPFIVGGYRLQHPCDPHGPPSEIIHCRCIHGPANDPPNPEDIEGNNPSTPIPY